MVYNFGSDNAYFFDRTHIWNRDGDYLYADRGEYRKADTLYIVTRNGYILTEKQEVWSDSIDYYRAESRAILRHDLQLDDTEHKTMAFGDYGESTGRSRATSSSRAGPRWSATTSRRGPIRSTCVPIRS